MPKSEFIILGFLFSMLLIIGCEHHEPVKYDWNDESGYRWSALPVAMDGEAGFEIQKKSQIGISFINDLPKEDIYENRHYLNGSGVALGDVDGDGWTDIYFGQLNGPNKLYKNMGGLRFKEITDSAGVAHENYYTTGVAFADIDGDDDLDLIVTSMEGENVIYINDGDGNFEQQDRTGFSESRGSHTIALADIDSDGDLDMYITNYKKDNVLDLFNVRDLAWDKTIKEPYKQGADTTYTLLAPYDEHYTVLYNRDSPPERREIGRKDELFLNSGDGTFEKAEDLSERFLDSEGNPKGLEADWGLTAKFHDINKDGLPDLYVCNDFWTKDRIWINQGEGVFREMDPLKIRNMSFSAMGVDFSDVNRDGYWDIFVTEMLSQKHEQKLRQYIPDDPHPSYIGQYDNQPQYNRNSFYLNRGDNTFSEISYFSGLEASGWSWATRFLDVDLDGYEDLLITTGYTYDIQDMDAQEAWRNEMLRSSDKENKSYIDMYPSLHEPNKAFRNEGGIRFKDVSSEWGFEEEDISHGLATADLDHDGDLDLIVNRLNQNAAVYENKTSEPRIAVRLNGTPPNTRAVGAQVELHGGPVPQQDEISAGGDYLSHSDPLIVFAANSQHKDHKLTITWPDGKKSTIDSVQANRIYEVDQQSIPIKSEEDTLKGKDPVFEDVSARINHEHHEEPYDDFRIQPLLPMTLSKQGPGISWIDFDSDGDDDLFISSGRGGHLTVYENSGGSFSSLSLGSLTEKTSSDQTTILGWKKENQTTMVTGNANYEPGDIKTPSVLHHAFRNGKIANKEDIPGIFSTTGPLAAADYNGDRKIDLFVGGRFVPAHYPMDASSRLFKKEAGQFVLDTLNSEMFDEVGLVTSAVFTDYDQDGDQDLLLSLEWGAIKLFEKRDGIFHDISTSMKLNQYKGWWNGIATGDFNNDGLPDIVATNWGLNSPYQLDTEHPLKMYYRDINQNGQIDIIESYYNPAQKGYVPRHQLEEYESISNMFTPVINNNKEFADAALNKILGYNVDDRLHFKNINTLQHMIFINEGDSFRAYPLPEEAQLTSAFYAGVADFNNDGNEDIFLTQNFFQVRENIPRQDAGRGLWLKGDGKGNFKTVPGHRSGVKVYGEQRGAALSDFNNDGRIDLVVSQNGAETKLYQNTTPNRGITVRLDGPAPNRDGIGSSIRLIYNDGTEGPRREVQAGSGYWSQNSVTQILGIHDSKTIDQIEVTWFDGSKDSIPVTSDQWEYEISYITR